MADEYNEVYKKKKNDVYNLAPVSYKPTSLPLIPTNSNVYYNKLNNVSNGPLLVLPNQSSLIYENSTSPYKPLINVKQKQNSPSFSTGSMKPNNKKLFSFIIFSNIFSSYIKRVFITIFHLFIKLYNYGKNSPFLGIFLGICSCVCIAFASLFISRIKSVSPLQVTNVRMIMQLMLSVPPLIYYSNALIPTKTKKQRKLLIPLFIRCVSGTIGVTCLTFSLVYAPIADSSAISYTSPVYVAILARVFLHERISLADSGLLGLAVLGVLFVTRPPFIFNFISSKLNEFDLGGNDPGGTHADIQSSFFYYDHDKMHHQLGLMFNQSLEAPFSTTLPPKYFLNGSILPYSNNNTASNLSSQTSPPLTDQLFPHRVLGLCFAVISSILTAVAMVTIRKINKLPFSTVLVNFSAVGAFGTALLCVALKHFSLPDCILADNTLASATFPFYVNNTRPPHLHIPPIYNFERIYILGSAILGTMGQFFLFLSLRFENAGVIAAVNSLTIVITILLQIMFQRKIPPWTSFLGSAIIIIAICLFGYRKWKVEIAKKAEKLKRYSSAKRASAKLHHSATAPALIDNLGKNVIDNDFSGRILKRVEESTPELVPLVLSRQNSFTIKPHKDGVLEHQIIHRSESYTPNFSSRPLGILPFLPTKSASLSMSGMGDRKPMHTELQVNVPRTISKQIEPLDALDEPYYKKFTAIDTLPDRIKTKQLFAPALDDVSHDNLPSSSDESDDDFGLSPIDNEAISGLREVNHDNETECIPQKVTEKLPRTRHDTSGTLQRSVSKKSSSTFSFFRKSSLHLSSLFGDIFSQSPSGGAGSRKNSASIVGGTLSASIRAPTSDLSKFDTDLLNIPELPDENQLTTNTMIVPQW